MEIYPPLLIKDVPQNTLTSGIDVQTARQPLRHVHLWCARTRSCARVPLEGRGPTEGFMTHVQREGGGGSARQVEEEDGIPRDEGLVQFRPDKT